MLKLFRVSISSSQEIICDEKDHLSVTIHEKLGVGRMCEAWRGNLYVPSDQLRHGNPVVIKRIVKEQYEDDAQYRRKTFEYFSNGQAYSRMYNQNPRGTSKVEGFFTDKEYYYILQVYLPGISYVNLKFHNRELEQELLMLKKVVELVSTYHNVRDLEGKLAPQFIGDLKPENFYAPMRDGNDTPDLVYFDFDVFDTETGSGVNSWNNRYMPYLQVPSCQTARRENDVTCIVLMLYERLIVNNKIGELPKERQRVRALSRLPIGDYVLKDYNKTSKDVNAKLKAMFQKGLQQKYRCCEELYEDIIKLLSFMHYENELMEAVPEITHMPIGRERIIENINNEFSKNKKCVYLYGIGGIGKTNAALKYAKVQNTFTRCYFVKFSKDMKTTIVENMRFSDYDDFTDGISNNEIYKSKMKFLRKYDEDTLIIIDDLYDKNSTLDEIRSTPEFVELCRLNIRLLFTTRYDMREEGVRVNALSIEECKQLFYKTLGNQSVPIEVLHKIIESVNGHTLMIKLIARTLQTSNISPEEMLEIIKKNSFDSADFVPFKIEDNYISSKERQEKKILEYLQELFDMAGLSDLEKSIISVLGFASGLRVHLDTFCKLLVNTNSFSEIKQSCLRLIDLGWIQTEAFEFVSVHSLIAQMASANSSINIKVSPILKNWLIEKYNVYEEKQVFSYGILRILRSVILESAQNETQDVKRILDNTMHAPLWVLASYELRDNFTAEKIVKSTYSNRNKPITFMIGQGSRTNNCYIFVYDGSQIIDAELLGVTGNVKWKGQVIRCWDSLCTTECNEFHFGSLIKYQRNDTVDIIEITEIARSCFANNRSIAYFEWGITKNEDTGEFVGLTKIGESAFENSNVCILRCDSSEIVRIEGRTFYNCKNLTSLLFAFSPIAEFGRESFANSWKLEEVIFDLVSNTNKEIEVETGAFFLCRKLKWIGKDTASVVRLNKVEKDAFYECSEIEHIEFQIAAEKVGDYAFEGCKGLRRIVFLSGVKNLGEKSFQGCGAISEIHFPGTIETIGKYAFQETKIKNVLIEGNIKRIEYRAFAVSDNLKSFSVRSNGKKGNAIIDSVGVPITNYLVLENVDIRDRAFLITDKTEIGIRGSVTVDGIEINGDASYLEKAFINIVFECEKNDDEPSPELFDEAGITWIFREAEERTKQIHKGKLLEISLNSLFYIIIGMIPFVLLHENNFTRASLVIGVYLVVFLSSKILDSKKYDSIMHYYLTKKRITDIRKKSKIGVTDFKSNKVFLDMKNQELCLPDTVIEVQDHAFYGKKMEYIKGSGVIKIGKGSFGECHKLKSFSFPKLKFIGADSMEGCISLEKISLPNIKIIGESAFRYCTNLTEVIFDKNLERIEEFAFDSCEKIKAIELPDTVVRIGASAFEASGLKNIIIPSMINIVENCTFARTPLEKVTLINNHVSISARAFFQCEKLDSINWDHIDSIGEYSFRSCAFEEIRLVNISNIPKGAFAYNKHLEKVEFVKDNIVLDDEAFWGDYQLRTISSQYITSIGKQALAYTDVEELWFENLSRIGEQAFVGAKRLERIFIKCSADSLQVGKGIFDECISLQQVWIYFDGNVEFDINAFPKIGYSIYVLDGSTLDKWAKESSITEIISVTPEVMEQKWSGVHK